MVHVRDSGNLDQGGGSRDLVDACYTNFGDHKNLT